MRPVAKVIALCDEVVADPISGKVSVLNLVNAIRVPFAEALPYRLAKLTVFGIFRGGRGPARFQVCIRRADTGEIFTTSSERIVDFMHPRATSYVLFRITNVPFPVTGEYFVELYCEHSFVDDQVLTVIESGGQS